MKIFLYIVISLIIIKFVLAVVSKVKEQQAINKEVKSDDREEV